MSARCPRCGARGFRCWDSVVCPVCGSFDDLPRPRDEQPLTEAAWAASAKAAQAEGFRKLQAAQKRRSRRLAQAVLRLVAEGLTRQAVAERLGVSLRTIHRAVVDARRPAVARRGVASAPMGGDAYHKPEFAQRRGVDGSERDVARAGGTA